LYTFSEICKGNAAINCIIVQHKKGSFPSTFTGHTMLVRIIIMSLTQNNKEKRKKNKTKEEGEKGR
jgi:hypothetical protein